MVEMVETKPPHPKIGSMVKNLCRSLRLNLVFLPFIFDAPVSFWSILFKAFRCFILFYGQSINSIN